MNPLASADKVKSYDINLTESQKNSTMRRTLQHTLELIGEFGIEGVTTKRISERMNMSTGILHHHFGTKDNIIYEAYAYFVEDVRLRAINLLKNQMSAEKRLLEFGELHFHTLHSSPVGANIWLNLWYKSVQDARVKRLLNIYHRRLVSKLTFLFLQIDPDHDWAKKSALHYFALIQGLWVSFVLSNLVTDTNKPSALLQQELNQIISNKHKGATL